MSARELEQQHIARGRDRRRNARHGPHECNATGTYQRDDTRYSRAFLTFWIHQAG